MPNLVGIYGPGLSRETVVRKLSEQLRRVDVPSVHYTQYEEIAEGFGAGLLDHGILENGEQPAVDQEGRQVLFLDGEIYNLSKLCQRFPGVDSGLTVSPARCCLELISTHGVDIVKFFNGLFCLVLYDRIRQELTLISDRFGFRSLFYVQSGNLFIFASELKGVTVADTAKREVDEVGTLELFVYGSHFGDKTWLRDYLRLPPATILRVDTKGLRSQRYWSYRYDESASRLDQGAYVSTYGQLLEQGVTRCLRGSHRIGIFLSGGYDSRSVAAAIPKSFLPCPAFTFGQAESRDLKYARMLALRLGLEHHWLTESGPYLYPYCHQIVWRTEGMIPFANCTSMRFHDLLKKQMDVILLGFLGEFSGSHTWPALLLARSRKAVKQAIWDHLVTNRISKIRQVFNPEFFSSALVTLRERFDRSVDAVENDHPLNIADAWNFTYLQPRGTFQSPSVDRYMFEARAPHMDADLVDFLLTIPPYARVEQRIYKKVIAYRFPEIRDIPCTNSGKPINPRFVQEYSGMVADYVLRKASAWLNGRSDYSDVRHREFRDLAQDFRNEPQLGNNILLPLLDSGIIPASIFDYRGIRDVIAQHYQADQSHEYVLSLLISYGLALQYFVFDDFSGLSADVYVAQRPAS